MSQRHNFSGDREEKRDLIGIVRNRHFSYFENDLKNEKISIKKNGPQKTKEVRNQKAFQRLYVFVCGM